MDRAPYAVEVIVQTNVTMQPVSLAIHCDVEVEEADVRMVGALVFTQHGNGYVGDKKTFWAFWRTPPFAPESPIVAKLMAKQPIKVLHVTEGPPNP